MALKEYNGVIVTASLVDKDDARVSTALSRDTYMLLGVAHLDAARMERELLDVSNAEDNRRQQQRIADHLSLAQQALTRGLQLNDRALAEIREYNRPLPIQQRRFPISSSGALSRHLGKSTLCKEILSLPVCTSRLR